ncbi:alpha-ribazole phosphatase [Marinilabiliaceae bacterium JC017]|nr:alpha-ribazole phosphatase [Marinilabiliaceae bacterium JC017]
MTKEIFLIRHTTPNVAQGVCYGQLDLNVADSFRKEAKQIRDVINNNSIRTVYSSPLIRCTNLAQYLFPENGVMYLNELMEMNFGQWEGKVWSKISPEALKHWSNNFLTIAPPEGESFSQMIDRVKYFWCKNILKSTEDSIAICTHSGVMRVIAMELLGIPPDKIFNLKMNYGAVIKIQINQDFHQLEFLKG